METPAHIRIPGLTSNVREFVEYGIRNRVEEVPTELVAVDVYTPSTSVTPWDCYGRRHWREVALVLGAAGIPCEVYTHQREGTRAIGALGGTGPGGRVRQGDDMMPSTYTVAVHHVDVERAMAALTEHRLKVQAWLFTSGEYPAILSYV